MISERLRITRFVLASLICFAFLALPGLCDETSDVLGEYKYESSVHEEPIDRVVVYYFGSSSCPPCLTDENVQRIKKMKIELAKLHPEKVVSFVIAWSTPDIEQALNDVRKYGEWDEVMIGNRWHNEAFLRYLSGESKGAGIPHLMVFEDTVKYSKSKRAVVISKRKLKVDIFGNELEKWEASGYSLKYRGRK